MGTAIGLAPAVIAEPGVSFLPLPTHPRQMHTRKMVVHVKLYGPWPQVVFPGFEAANRVKGRRSSRSRGETHRLMESPAKRSLQWC